MPSDTAQSARRRLSPEDRRNQLLDCAQYIILNQGLSKLTIEQLATEAGVSHPLIYKYFDTRLQILQELLVREYSAFRKSVTQNVAKRCQLSRGCPKLCRHQLPTVRRR